MCIIIKDLSFTKEAIGGIHQQLDKTSLMAWQNRQALDMLLAEKGGVCRMFGDMCQVGAKRENYGRGGGPKCSYRRPDQENKWRALLKS